jgi:hypothetical protein
LALACYPEIRIQEQFGAEFRNKVAIEVKGDTDASNAYNRTGEAEKSHQKANASPTTNSWFD